MEIAEFVDDTPGWRWRWESMCGPPGLNIWSPDLHDFGLCFQQLCLQIPTLSLLAIGSAYYSGTYVDYVVRNKFQKRTITLRSIISLIFALLPILQVYIDVSHQGMSLYPIHIFISAVQCLTWLIHSAYVLALKKRLGKSPRGPIFICVVWTLYAVLTAMSLHSHYLVNQYDDSFRTKLSYKFSITMLVLQCLYAITLLPGEGNTEYTLYTSRYSQIGEQQPLLRSTQIYAFNSFIEEQDPNYLGVAMEYATVLSRMLFYWVNPLIKKGLEKKLDHPDDLYDLPLEISCGTVSLKLDKALMGDADSHQREIEQHNAALQQIANNLEYSPEIPMPIRSKVSLLRALHKCFWFQFYIIGIFKFMADCSNFAGPLLLNRLVNFIENNNEDVGYGYLYAFGLFLSTLVGALCNSHFNFYMTVVGLKIRASLVTAIYRKTLTVGGTTLNSAFSIGEIVNFMSTDTDRIVNSCPSFHAIWSIPLQLSITLFLLFQQVGVAFVAGVAFSIILIPINKYIASKIGELSTKMMTHKDERVKMMTELLRGIRSIKLFVWEAHFIRLITKLRALELRYLKGRKYLDALCVYFWATTPVLISILTFGTYVWFGNKLTAATVFTSMALLNMLIAPLNAFPWVLNGLTEAWVSIKRIQRLLDMPDLDLDEYYDNSILEDNEETHILIKNVSFNWSKFGGTVKIDHPKKSEKNEDDASSSANIDETQDDVKTEFCLDAININVTKAGLIGKMENEKLHFHHVILNEFINQGQFVGITGQVGSGKSSLLGAILAELEKTSGSVAVSDLETGFGYVSQQPWLQRGTIRDNILFGKAFNDEKYRAVLYACCLTDDIYLLPSGDLTGIGDSGVTLSGGQKARIALARAVYQDKPIYLLDDVISAVDRNVAKHIFNHCIMKLLENKTRILCTHHTQYLVNADYVLLMDKGRIVKQGVPNDVLPDFEEYILPLDLELADRSYDSKVESTESSVKEEDESAGVLNEESRSVGTIQLEVYGFYWKSVGHLLVIAILISITLMQTSRNMTDWWLSYWVSNTLPNKTINSSDSFYTKPEHLLWLPGIENDSMSFYMSYYGMFVGMNTIFTLLRAFLFAYGGIMAASRIHRILLKVIVKAKVKFFDISPLGRILNRFSSDTYTIDDSLPFIMNILFAQIFGVIGSVVVTIYGLPWLILVLAPLIPVYHWLQRQYRLTSRELKRLSSVTLSPVYSHFNETLQGLATIRALRATQRFKRDNEDNVEANQKAQFASSAAAQWLGLRLQFIGVAMVTGVGLIAVLQHQFDKANAGLVGLAISYALSITGLLSGVVNAFTETEREMIAVERVNQYIEQVETEKSNVILDPPYAWPPQGTISFNNVVMKYRDHLAPSLKGVTFETRPAEKVGVVGRTGAGKSSLFCAMFRLAELYSGNIVIDTVNIKHISLDALRSRISIIPQEPFLFSGTLRENLDPLEEFREQELWAALTKVNLLNVVRGLGGLDFKLGTGGNNMSVGQRQLLCLARAILRNAKILCIDEATANVDHATDRLIQQTLRNAFRKSTVITIAHRIQTILDYDRVLVMGDGQVLEFDNPDVLLEDHTSHFYQMVKGSE